jgi:hypothetical protein
MALMPDGSRRYIGEVYSSERKALAALSRLTLPVGAKVYVVHEVVGRP